MIKKEKKFINLISDCSKKDMNILISALDFSIKVHRGQKRKSGEDYVIHPISVAHNIYKKYKDINLTVAALLHDVVEDGQWINMRKIYKKFGGDVGFIVDAVTKTTNHYYNNKKIFSDKIGKMLWGGMKDPRVLLLKIFDRENNLSDLENLTSHKQVRMSFETQAIYYPLHKILQINKELTLKETGKIFNAFLLNNNIKDENQLKDYLLKDCFFEISNYMYNMIYKNSDRVIWTIEDKSFYSDLCNDKNFYNTISLLSLWSDGKNFRAAFSFKKGIIPNNINTKFKILKYKK
ncbi:MAG: HD domain-containing protein [Patescibacteria group bacterium]|nr:HD domain-containing protein [Patescibacteria group bacterium]MDD4304558.1 HD domain-containing protein [Patescibacteria group bacterium]MDD4695745.1 HD domain-containing protein [Patescibacteria group bacterium]